MKTIVVFFLGYQSRSLYSTTIVTEDDTVSMLEATRPVRHEGVWCCGGITPLIVNLGTRWRCVMGLTPSAFLPSQWVGVGESLCCSLNIEACVTPNPVWTTWHRQTCHACQESNLNETLES